jgi:hypothetical protein
MGEMGIFRQGLKLDSQDNRRNPQVKGDITSKRFND